MKSRWYDKKADALALRRNGVSIRVIEKSLGIPRSTLSGWFKDVSLQKNQRSKLSDNQLKALAESRKKAVAWHNDQKQLRVDAARESAVKVMQQIKITPAILDLALAMLYLGEGKKSSSTVIANSNPMILRFVLDVVHDNYGVDREQVICELHIRADQTPDIIKKFWSEQLSIPIDNFRYVYIDKRTEGKPTYDSYKGVCVVNVGGVAVLRKLTYLYNLFCETVSNK